MKVIRIPRRAAFIRILRLLAEAGAGRILLAVPRGARAFREAMSLDILRLYARERGLEILFVSGDPDLLARAGAAGFPALPRLPESAVEQAAGREETVARRPLPFWPLAFLFLAIALTGTFFLLPRSTVVVVPARRRLSVQAAAVVSPAYKEAQIPAGRLPGSLLHKTGLIVYETAATGSRIEGATPSTGTVVFLNETAEALAVPVGTIVQGANGLRFRTQAAVTVPPARYGYLLGVRVSTTSGQAGVEVAAEKPGSQGNLGPGKVTAIIGPLARRLKVINPEGFTGGTDRRVAVVAPEDAERARAEARRQMELQAPEELRALAGSGQILLTDSLAVSPGREAVTPAVGEAAPSVRMTLAYRVQGLCLPRAVLAKFLEERARREVPANFTVAGEPFSVEELRSTALSPEEARLEVTAAYTVVGRLDRGRILAFVRGKSAASARASLLGLPEVAAVQMDLPPGRRFPNMTWLIRLELPESGTP